MSIFKESFPQFVRDQLKTREKIISSGADGSVREDNFYTYSLNKQCTLRLSSGVDIDQDSKSAGMLFANEISDLNDIKYGGNVRVPAMKYMLQGGIPFKGGIVTNQTVTTGLPSYANLPNSQLAVGGEVIKDLSKASEVTENIPEARSYDGDTSLRGGFGESYGDPYTRSDARNGFGIVPMPGITKVDIKTKSAYGSLREARVTFVCHNQRQLEIMEMLYMRPGYSLLLEWGWSPYIDNKENKVNQVPFIDGFFDADVKAVDIEKKVYNNKQRSDGNYDALFGFCKNFEYTLRPDGGFDCMTEIVAKGEILEGLKESEDRIQEYSGDKSAKYGQFTYIPRNLILLKKIRMYSEVKALNTQYVLKNRFIGQGFEMADGSPEEKIRMNIGNSSLEQDLELNETEGTYPYILTKENNSYEPKQRKSSVLKATANFGDHTSYKSRTTYIRWDAYAHLINKFLVPLDDYGSPLFVLQTNHILKQDKDTPEVAPLLYNKITPGFLSKALTKISATDREARNSNTDYANPKTYTGHHAKLYEQKTKTENADLQWSLADVSTNPQICVLPHTLHQQWYRASEYGTTEHHKKKFLTDIKANKTLYPPLSKGLKDMNAKSDKINIDRDLSRNEIEYAIGHIYLGVEWLTSLFKEMYYLSNGAVNPQYSTFKFIKRLWEGVNGVLGGGHNFDIHVDNDPSGKVIRVIDLQIDSNELDLSEGKIHELKIQSLDSVVRDVKYNTTIPTSLSATIAISAQAPDSIDNLDAVTFAAINKGIHDRFSSKKDPTSPTEERIAKWKAQFNQHVYELSSAIGAFSYTSEGSVTETVSNWNRSGVLVKLLIKHEEGNAFIDSDDGSSSPEIYSGARGALKSVQKCIRYFNSVYGSDSKGSSTERYLLPGSDWTPEKVKDKYGIEVDKVIEGTGAGEGSQFGYKNDGMKKYYVGQPIPPRNLKMSSIIPLKFNARLDGISGIKIGNIFKLPKSRLPYAYREDDIYFIVMGEEQSIDGQDWVTSIRGHLILLGGSETGNLMDDKLWKESWAALNGEISIHRGSIEDLGGVRSESSVNFGAQSIWEDYVNDKAWSAAFISTMAKKAGSNFPVNGNHMAYAQSIRKGNSEWKALNPLTTPIKTGDILVFNRNSNNKTFYSKEWEGDGHADIVQENFMANGAYKIGGNLSDSVSKVFQNCFIGNTKITSKIDDQTTQYNPYYIPADEIAVSSWGEDKIIGDDDELTFTPTGLDSNDSSPEVTRKFEDFDGVKKRCVCILRSNRPQVRHQIAANALEAWNRWGKGGIDELDPIVATELHSYYKTANMNPPNPYLGEIDDESDGWLKSSAKGYLELDVDE